MRVGAELRIARTCALGVVVLGCARPPAAHGQGADGTVATAPCGPASTETEPAPRPQPRSAACEGGDLWKPGPTTSCNSFCLAESVIVSRCIESQRKELVLQAPCECGPANLSAELSGCRWGQMSVVPREAIHGSSHAAVHVDGCKLNLECAPGKLSVVCDGEEDGTGTSLCDCYFNGKPLPLPGTDVWPGEGPGTCHAAAPACLQAAMAAR
jgi:hypothetical protein